MSADAPEPSATDYLPLIRQRIHRRRDPVAYYRGTSGGGERDKSTSYGEMDKRQCNVCGNRTVSPVRGTPWPACGHDDWQWIKQPRLAPPDGDGGLFDLLDDGGAA